MKGLLLIIVCYIFLILSLTINKSLATLIKEIITWGGFIIFLLVLREIRKLKINSGKNNKWDEDP